MVHQYKFNMVVGVSFRFEESKKQTCMWDFKG